MLPVAPVQQLREGHPGGRRVLLAHGLEDGWASWQPLVDRLDPSWNVRALDLPWRAGTDYRWRSQGSATDWLAANLRGEPVQLLIAHSYGATAALELMAAGSLSGVDAVLICPLYRPPEIPVSWQMLDQARISFEAHIRDGVRARMGERAQVVGAAVLEAMMARTVQRVGPTGLLTVFDRFTASADIPLARVRQRTLVVAGGHDPTLSRRAATRLGEQLPAGRALVVDDFDHFCYVRHPDRVARHIHDAFDPPRVTTPRLGPDVEKGA